MSMLNGATRWRDVAIWRCPLECSIRVWSPPPNTSHILQLFLSGHACIVHVRYMGIYVWDGLVFCLLKNKTHRVCLCETYWTLPFLLSAYEWVSPPSVFWYVGIVLFWIGFSKGTLHACVARHMRGSRRCACKSPVREEWVRWSRPFFEGCCLSQPCLARECGPPTTSRDVPISGHVHSGILIGEENF